MESETGPQLFQSCPSNEGDARITFAERGAGVGVTDVEAGRMDGSVAARVDETVGEMTGMDGSALVVERIGRASGGLLTDVGTSLMGLTRLDRKTRAVSTRQSRRVWMEGIW